MNVKTQCLGLEHQQETSLPPSKAGGPLMHFFNSEFSSSNHMYWLLGMDVRGFLYVRFESKDLPQPPRPHQISHYSRTKGKKMCRDICKVWK